MRKKNVANASKDVCRWQDKLLITFRLPCPMRNLHVRDRELRLHGDESDELMQGIEERREKREKERLLQKKPMNIHENNQAIKGRFGKRLARQS